MTDEKVKCLSGFVARVRHIREEWRIDEHKELWFRGEGEKHQESILRPGLYRPRRAAKGLITSAMTFAETSLTTSSAADPPTFSSRFFVSFQTFGSRTLSR